MRELIEFRLWEDTAAEYLGDLGSRLGKSARRLTLELSDPLVERISEIEREKARAGDIFVTSWRIKREYTQSELDNAELLQLLIVPLFEPAGEECGTEYDVSTVCQYCGAGRRQKSPLRLDTKQIPKGVDFASSIARDEWVISKRVGEALIEEEITGLHLAPLESCRSGKPDASPWKQMLIRSQAVEMIPPTKFGVNPFGTEAREAYRCPLGHVAGLNILSNVSVARKTWDGSDFCITSQAVGKREGLLAPSPLILISARLWKRLEALSARGFEVEVVELL